MKVAVFDPLTFSIYKDFWKEQFQFEVEQVKTEDFKKTWNAFSKQYGLFLLTEFENPGVFQTFTEFPTGVVLSSYSDVLLKKNGKWWPQNFWLSALKECIVKNAESLDTRSAAYVTGSGHLSRSCVYLLSQLGFSKIYWVRPPLEPEEQIFVRKILATHLSTLGADKLTLQPSNGSILINTVTVDNQELIKDLSYLNFLHSDGVVVDAHLLPIKNPLLEEADNVKIKKIAASEILAVRDYTLLQSLPGPLQLPSQAEYAKIWQEFLKTRLTSS
jgi:hypothetical protein